jgi:hypothetical protein
MIDSTKQMVPILVADIVEERTGKRPVMNGLQPGVSLDGGKVQITLNGLSQSDLGQLSVADVTSETANRTQKWVTHALGLLGSVSSTKEILSFEDDVLGALLDGFAAAGWKAPAPTTINVPTPGGAKK